MIPLIIRKNVRKRPIYEMKMATSANLFHLQYSCCLLKRIQIGELTIHLKLLNNFFMNGYNGNLICLY